MVLKQYRCLVGVRRLSRKTDATSSPQRQGDQILQATADVGGHIVAWADDWEVSGATDPLRCRSLPARLRIGVGDARGDDPALLDVLRQFGLGGEGLLIQHAGGRRT